MLLNAHLLLKKKGQSVQNELPGSKVIHLPDLHTAGKKKRSPVSQNTHSMASTCTASQENAHAKLAKVKLTREIPPPVISRAIGLAEGEKKKTTSGLTINLTSGDELLFLPSMCVPLQLNVANLEWGGRAGGRQLQLVQQKLSLPKKTSDF